MKHALLISALTWGFSAFAQDSSSPPATSTFNRILLGFGASADYCSRTLDNAASTNAVGTAPLSDEDQPKFGYTAGLKMQYNLTPHWGIGIGAQYADRGYATELSSYWIMVDPMDPAIPSHTTFRYHHSFIDIPVRLIFQAGRHRLRFTTSLGVAGNVLLKASTVREVEYADGHVVRTRMDGGGAYRQVNLSAIASAGVAYQFTERSSLQLEPSFRYNLFSIVDGPPRTHLWSGGLELTFYYALP